MITEDLLKELRMALDGVKEVRFAYIFGSAAKGRTHKFSDVDVAIYVEGDAHSAFGKVFRELALNFKSEVDLVILNSAPPLLRHRVLLDGVLIFSHDEKQRKKFVEETLIEALEFREDYEWMVEEKKRMLLYDRG